MFRFQPDSAGMDPRSVPGGGQSAYLSRFVFRTEGKDRRHPQRLPVHLKGEVNMPATYASIVKLRFHATVRQQPGTFLQQNPHALHIDDSAISLDRLLNMLFLYGFQKRAYMFFHTFLIQYDSTVIED
jgi:hypothetical protein